MMENIIKIIGACVLAILFIIPPMVVGAKLEAGENEGLIFFICILAIVAEVVTMVCFLMKEIGI